MILSTHGFLASSGGVAIDPDALAFFGRVDTATSTTDFLTNTEKTAINKLVLDLKANSLWTPMKAIYPMVGGGTGTTAQRQAACSQNLKSSSFTGTFTATGWTFASTGATPNGTSAFMNTGLNMLNDLSQNNSHLAIYSRTNNTILGVMAGCGNGLNNSIVIYPRFTNNTAYLNHFTSGGNNTVTNQNDSFGFRMINRIISTEFSFFNRNTKSILSLSSIIGSNLNIFLGANNSNGTAATFDNRENAFSSIGDGLTDTQASDFYTAVQAFQTTLSRQV